MVLAGISKEKYLQSELSGALKSEVASSNNHFPSVNVKPKFGFKRRELETDKYSRLQLDVNTASTYCIYNLAPLSQLLYLINLIYVLKSERTAIKDVEEKEILNR